jgi:hypothetical protein
VAPINGDVLVAVPSPYIPFREITAGGIFGTGIDEGLVIMLRAYFDDSGRIAQAMQYSLVG